MRYSTLTDSTAVVVDLTFATDQPGVQLGPITKHDLDSGPVVARGTTLHPLVFEQLWLRLWVVLAVVALFLFVSYIGVWAWLGDTAHIALLGAFLLTMFGPPILRNGVRLVVAPWSRPDATNPFSIAVNKMPIGPGYV